MEAAGSCGKMAPALKDCSGRTVAPVCESRSSLKATHVLAGKADGIAARCDELPKQVEFHGV